MAQLNNFGVRMRDKEICEAMMKFALKFSENQEYENLRLEHFTDGLPLAHILISSDTIGLSLDELEINTAKWIAKVSNLKKILSKIHSFLEAVNEKTDRIKDIDVVEIAKNTSVEYLARLFEVVVSVLMNSTGKEKYIQLIMTLDETVQNTFVEIIQNSLDQQIFPSQQNSNVFRLEEELVEIKKENSQLKIELSETIRKYKSIQREVYDLKERVMNFEDEEQKVKSATDYSANQDNLQSQLEQQRVLIDNLKLKLISTVRENQIELSQLREQVSLLRLKTKNMEELESTLDQYKEMYNQNLNDQQKLIELEKEKRRLTRQIEEKDQTIKKLHGRIDTTIEKNYSMQENEIYMKLELEKREVRFKQLEKEVKTRLKSQPSEITPRINDIDPREEEKEEIVYLQDQLNKTKICMKELEKESIKNRKRLQRMAQLEAQKKKLQKIILQVNRSKDSEIQLLVVSLYQLRNENIKLFELIKSSTEMKINQKR